MFKLLILTFSFTLSFHVLSGEFLREFYFETGIDTLSGNERIKLNKLNKLIMKFNVDSVFITGYADKDGRERSNFMLSKRRATFVRKGLNMSENTEVVITWLGENFEEYTYDSLQKFKNRKVKIRVKHKGKRYKAIYFNGKRIRKGDVLELPSIQFVPGKSIMLPGGEKILNEIVEILKANPRISFLVEGHVCCQNEVELSENRAKMVYCYLIEHAGIEEKRLKYYGFGLSKPKFHINDARNRRVELKVLKI